VATARRSAKLQITHHANAPVTAVAVDYKQAAVDPYTFPARRDPRQRWQLAREKAVRADREHGTVNVTVAWPANEAVPNTIVVEFVSRAGGCLSVRRRRDGQTSPASG